MAIIITIIIVVLVVEYYTKQKERRLDRSVFSRHYCYIFRVVLCLCLVQANGMSRLISA